MNEVMRKTPERGAVARVYAVLSRNVGLPVSIDDLAAETGLEKNQVAQAIAGLRHRRNMDIEQVLAGVYRLRSFARPEQGLSTLPQTPTPASAAPLTPQQSAGKRMFEEIGVTREGKLVIQSTDGGLYRAEEL